ncbi:MAG: TIGR02597 family protein [Opitutaceae bacterium]|nr:TIGR02597 family protein [Opitutaceae bacterium]
MKTLLRLFPGLLALALVSVAHGQTVAATPAAGYFKLTARGASDSLLSIPLVKRSAMVARVSAVGPGALTLTPAGATDGAYAPASGASYYVQFASGALEGVCYKILNNASGVFTLATGDEDLTSHSLGTVLAGESGDIVRIRPYWTVAEVFGSDEGSLQLDPVSELTGGPYTASDAILLPDNAAAGAEKRPLTAIAYLAGAGWRAPGSPAADLAAQELPPGMPFAVRRQRAEPAGLVVAGYVSPERFLVRLPPLVAGADHDVAVALAHPQEPTLADAGLFSAGPAGSVIQASPDALDLRDVLLEFDTERRGFALPPARRFYVLDTGWYEAGTAADDHTLQPGIGYILRLRGERPGRYWVQPPPE